MSLFERLKNKTLSLREKKEDKTDKGVKQSEVSKQAKKFTKKINQKNINRPEGVIGDTYVSTDKKGNIRSAKKVNPTLKKSVSQVKADIEFKQGIQQSRKLSGSKGTGELSDKAPQNVRSYVKKVRDKRIKDLKLPDTSFNAKTKFSQKAFEKSLKTSTKGPKTGIVDPFKGSAITKGQANVKGLASKAFKKTKPSDIKLPKSFTDFQKNLQDYKDKDKATMRTGKSSSKVKVSGANNLTRQDVGMAPPDKPKTKVVKQSEVSKQAKAFTNQIAQQKKAKTDKVVDLATKKQQSKLSQAATNITQQRDDAIVKREKLRSVKGVKDTKAIRSTNRQVKELDKLAKQTQKAASGVGNPNAPVKYNKMTAGADFIKKNRKGPELPNFIKNKTNNKMVTKHATKKSVSFKIPGGEAIGEPKLPKFSTGITKSGNISFAKDPTKLGGMKLNKTTQAIVKRETSRALRRPENVKFAVAAAKRKGFARGATRFIGKLGPKGRLAATVLGAGSYLATKPGVRNFVRNAAIGTGLAGVLGFAGKKEKVLKKGDGLKTVGKVDVRYGLTGSKTNKDGKIIKSGGKIYDPKQMAQLGKVQKNFIDKYNQKAARNPFKKQIQYKPKADGTYKILDPKKK